ncbi:MAG: alpha/beta hydrolase [Pseudomonadales bacterium]|nr:alpha/beta hydrolase [Pseudomonadales bacterium]
MFVENKKDGVEIYYEIMGPAEAPCIIFAHGARGNAASWWQQVPYFVESYRVIIFDHRGFGRSSCSAEQFSAQLFEEDVLAIMNKESIDKAALVCQSMGGWTGARLSAFYPDRVSCLFLANTSGAICAPEQIGQMRKKQAESASEPITYAAISAEFCEKSPELGFLYDAIGSFTLQPPPIGNIMLPEAFLSERQVAALKVPAMVMSSDLDTLFPRALLEVGAGMIGAETIHIANAGHSTYFEQPAAFNAAVGEFLGRHCK